MSILKRTIITLVSILFIAVAPVTAMAETYFSDGEFEFVKTAKGNGLITSCELTDADIVVPEFVLDYPIAGIGDYAFMNMPTLKSISMPLAVVSIGEYAFAGNSQLFIVRIPKYCNNIASTAFANSPNVTIVGYEDSYAKVFAENNNLAFEPIKTQPNPPITEPTEPSSSEETTSTEPTQPSSSEETTSTEPTAPSSSENTNPTEITEPSSSEATTPSESTQPSSSENTTPTEVTEPSTSEATTPSESTQPSSLENTNPTEVTEPSPTETTTPTEATDPSSTNKPTVPKLNKSSLKLKAGSNAVLKVTGAKVKNWKSFKKTVAIVKNGKVTALKKGNTNIVVTLTNGKKLYCKVKVTTSPTIKVGKKKYSKKTTYSIKHGKKLIVSVSGKAKSIGNKYKTTNKKIAKITSKATAKKIVIKAYKKGKAKITVKVNGVSFTIDIRVT